MTDGTTDVVVFRIARETHTYRAVDISGAGAASCGGRWNAREQPMVYAGESRALAALETLAHIRDGGTPALPFDRYLVEIRIPAAAWKAREVFDDATHVAWNAIPGSATALQWGTAWAQEMRTLVAVVPSVIVPEESNVLLNPKHPDAGDLVAKVVRLWTYDPRFGHL